jgi:hypothetical protein
MQQLLRVQLRYLLQLPLQAAHCCYSQAVTLCCLYLLHGDVKQVNVLCLQVAGYSTCAAAEVLEELNGALPLNALHLQLLKGARLLWQNDSAHTDLATIKMVFAMAL